MSANTSPTRRPSAAAGRPPSARPTGCRAAAMSWSTACTRAASAMSALATAAAAATAAGAATRAHGARGCSPSSDPSLLHAAGSDVLFRKAPSLAALNASSRNTAMEALGIVFTEIGDDYVRGTMPVAARTHQPYGLLHGGDSVRLAETLGSSAGHLCVGDHSRCVGIEIHAQDQKSGLEVQRFTVSVDLGALAYIKK